MALRVKWFEDYGRREMQGWVDGYVTIPQFDSIAFKAAAVVHGDDQRLHVVPVHAITVERVG